MTATEVSATHPTPPPDSPLTIDSLTAQLDEGRERIEEAEVELGAAVLDRKGQAAAQKRFEQATTEVRRLEAVINVATQRTADAQRTAEIEGEELALAGCYDFVGGYAPMVAHLLEAREAIGQLEEEIRERIRSAPRRLRTLLRHGSEKVQREGMWTRRMIDETEFDVAAIRSVPLVFGTGEALEFGERLTPQRCAEAAERAAELAEACRVGRHADVAVTGAERAAERKEHRQRRAAEYRAKLDAEQAAKDKHKADRESAEVEKKGQSPKPSSQDLARQRELSGEAKARAEVAK